MTYLTKWDPFEDFEEFFSKPLLRPSLVTPMTDVYSDDEKNLVIEAHVPGFTKKDIAIDLHNGVLEVRGEKLEKQEEKKKRRYYLQESSSNFLRRVRLPENIDSTKIKADFDNGTLKITIPFKELPQPKRIEIAEGKKKK